MAHSSCKSLCVILIGDDGFTFFGKFPGLRKSSKEFFLVLLCHLYKYTFQIPIILLFYPHDL